jgi:hypothetical protein
MIQKFEQFINENVNKQDVLGTNELINEPVSDFISRVQERTEIYIKHINDLVSDINKALEDVMTEFGDIIIGEPIVEVSNDLWDINVKLNTNIQNTDEAWETDESPAQKLDENLYDLMRLGRYKKVRAEVLPTPNEDGNCVICISADIVYKTNFGEFADAISKFGEEY